MDMRNFDLTTEHIIKKARMRAITYMIFLGIGVILSALLARWMLPNNVEITIGLMASLGMAIMAYSLFDRLCGLIVSYMSESRKHMEDEIASRMIYLKNMTDKKKSPPSGSVQ